MVEKANPSGWGYLLQDPPYPQAPGGRVLTLWFRAEPTGEHFDPEKAAFPVIERWSHGPTGDRFALSEVKIGHPWEGKPSFRVAPGRVRVWDVRAHEVGWLTFGGTLTLERQGEVTVARLTSSAPIIEVAPEDEVILLFIEETEELLAQRRAAHLGDKLEELAARMYGLDPWLLYCVTLGTLAAKFAALSALPLEKRVLAYLRQQLHLLQAQERCPRTLPSLEEVL